MRRGVDRPLHVTSSGPMTQGTAASMHDASSDESTEMRRFLVQPTQLSGGGAVYEGFDFVMGT